MHHRIALAAFLTLLAAGPSLAQQAAPRATTATGVTKPPARVSANADAKGSTDEQMRKAQRAAVARDKAWDTKMRTTMGSICQGC